MKAALDDAQPRAHWRYTAELILLAAAYFGAARLALAFAIPPGYATPVWPSSGIALAALLLLGLRAWPGVWIGAALVNFTVSASLPLALLIATGNALEALAGAALVKRYVGIPYRFERSADVVKFVAATLLAGAIAASVAVIPLAVSHALEGAALYTNWWTWWQGDVAGMILVTPLILSWCSRGSVIWTRPKILEAAAFCLLLALAAALIFGGDSAFFDFYPMKFGLVLFVIWAAYRFSQREVATAVAVIAVAALWDSVAGIGTSWPWLNTSLLVLLAFNVTLAITGLVLCAVTQERAAAMAALERARLQLETRVRERTAEIERAQAVLVQAHAAAERASAEKSMFLAKMSHEFRTPLNSLMILAQLLADNPEGNLTEKQVEYARTIFGAGTDLAVLVSDILQAARDKWDQSATPVTLAPERVAALRDYCERTFRPVAAGKGLEFSIAVGPDVPAVLHTAAHRLRQILNNLLANAFRFTATGGVRLRIERAYSGWSAGHGRLDTAPGVIAFSVTDTGIGFAPGFRAVMFEEFRREGHQPGSTGLGLAISRQLTDLLGGEITAASTPGTGSTFTVYLPLIEAPTPAAIGRSRQPEQAAIRTPDNGASP